MHYVFRRVSKKAGLPPVHPHMLRHTWATLMINRGVPLNYVSRALGHHSTAFTAGVYATAIPEAQRHNADALATQAAAPPPPTGLVEKASQLASSRGPSGAVPVQEVLDDERR